MVALIPDEVICEVCKGKGLDNRPESDMHRTAGGDGDMPKMRRAGPYQRRARQIVAFLAAAILILVLSHKYPNPAAAATRKAARAVAIPALSIFWAFGASPFRMRAKAARKRRSATVTAMMYALPRGAR